MNTRAEEPVTGDPAVRDALLRSQVEAFRRQIPMMYFIVCVNTIALAWTHYGKAPEMLTLVAPAILIGLSLLRLFSWWRLRSETVTTAIAARSLRGTMIFAGVLGISFAAWALSLFPHGDPYTKMHIVFSMAVTLLVASVCLTHMKAAAFLLIGIATIPFVIFFGSIDSPVMRAVSINLLLVAAGLVLILDTLYRDFETLIAARKTLEDKQAELEAANREISRTAITDSLTGLPNRRGFFAELEEALSVAAATKQRLAVGVLDLDAFKPVNDTMGHFTGDRVLVEVAERLATLRNAGIYAARIGGDEFGLVLSGAISDDNVRRAGGIVCDLLSKPYNAGSGGADIAASVGFACYPQAGATVEELYECADYALYQAKRNARGTTVLFDESHEPNIRQLRLMLKERRSRVALNQG